MSIISQLEASTQKWYLLKSKNGAIDLYSELSFLLNYFIKQKKGMFKRPGGGRLISVPVQYDDAGGGFFSRGDSLDSTDRDIITEIQFAWKNIFSNATFYWTDNLDNMGAEKIVDLLAVKLQAAVTKHEATMATSMYAGLEGDTENFTGLQSLTDATATVDYGGYSSNDIVSEDGTKVWTGKETDSATVISTNAIRTGKTAAAYGKGKKLEPDLMVTTETNFNTLRAVLEPKQKFTEMTSMSEPVKAGFNGVRFEGTDVFPDRFCTASNGYLLNSDHVGFAFHKNALQHRKPWAEIQGSAGDRTMKILSRGNLISDNRRANYRWSSLS